MSNLISLALIFSFALLVFIGLFTVIRDLVNRDLFAPAAADEREETHAVAARFRR